MDLYVYVVTRSFFTPFSFSETLFALESLFVVLSG